MTLQHVKTEDQRADIFTKGAHKWANAIHLLGISTVVPKSVEANMTGFKMNSAPQVQTEVSDSRSVKDPAGAIPAEEPPACVEPANPKRNQKAKEKKTS